MWKNSNVISLCNNGVEGKIMGSRPNRCVSKFIVKKEICNGNKITCWSFQIMSCLQTWTMSCTPIQNNLLQPCYSILRWIVFWYNVFSILEGFLQLLPKKLGKLWSGLIVKCYMVKHINPFLFNFSFFNHDREQHLASLGTGENIPLRLILISFNMSLIMLLLHQL